MSQNVWATIIPFGPVTPIFYWPKNFFSDQPKLALISGTAMSNGQTKTKLFYNCMLLNCKADKKYLKEHLNTCVI
jgi:hypothetical protein